MPIKAKIKLRHGVSWDLERSLVTTGKFRVFSRMPGQFVIFEKLKPQPPKLEVLVDGELPPEVRLELLQRCNNIVNTFIELHVHVIRKRLENICLTLPPLQREFVQKWMDKYVVEDQ
jgi:hypothetical protein